MNESDVGHLRRCVELAREALDAGEEPFGSVLVAADGTVLAEDHNRTAGGDQTRHPEFELARWAAGNMAPADRATPRSTPRANTARCVRRPMPGSASAGSSTPTRPGSSPPYEPNWVIRPRRC